MNYRLIICIVVSVFVSAACIGGQGVPTPDLDATLAVALAQTMTANPTATATQTLTPTSTLTATPVPTQTTSPTPTPEPVNYTVETLEDGWLRYSNPKTGFAISLPQSWVFLDLSVDDMERMLSYTSQTYPDVEYFFTAASLEESAEAGVICSATGMDLESAFSETGAYLDLYVDDVPFAMSIDEYTENIIQSLQDYLGEDLTIQQESLWIGDLETIKLTYETVDTDEVMVMALHLVFIQYVIFDGTTL